MDRRGEGTALKRVVAWILRGGEDRRGVQTHDEIAFAEATQRARERVKRLDELTSVDVSVREVNGDQ